MKHRVSLLVVCLFSAALYAQDATIAPELRKSEAPPSARRGPALFPAPAAENRQLRVITASNYPDPDLTVTNSLTVGTTTAATAKSWLLGSSSSTVAMFVDNYNTAGLAGLHLDTRGTVAAQGGALYHVGATSTRPGAFSANSTVLAGYDTAGLALVGSHATSGNIRFYTGDDYPAYERMRITATGRIGIGTAAPFNDAVLDVRNASNRTLFPNTPMTVALFDTNAYNAVVNGTTGAVGAGIGFGGFYNATETTVWAAISGVRETSTENNYAGALTFGTRPQGNGGQNIERMRLRSTGELVVGASGETGLKLTVNGDVVVSGNIGAKYQDVAEWVPATHDLAPGTVVVLNPRAVNEVMPSHSPYDTTVAGVVSAQPGLILGEAAANKEQIATTGRVRVRVDATTHPIAVGDLLVTSAEPGTAMYSSPVDVAGVKLHRPGTIIGKALEPLAAGEGEILVLLSMQ